MAFHVGQRVICILAPWEPLEGGLLPERPPVVHGIYTVDEIFDDSPRTFLGLAECGSQDCFNADYFRPIVRRTTDISVFQRMLLPERERA